MRGLVEYVKIKDRYLLSYMGPNEDYLLELVLIRPYLERRFPGLQIFLMSKDLYFSVIQTYANTLKESDLQASKMTFGHVRHLTTDGTHHPVETLLKESDVQVTLPEPPPAIRTTKCIIVSRGNHPTRPLTQHQKETLIRIARSEGYEPDESGDVEDAGLVMGVESYPLILAASKGIETRLVPTGIGTRLYRSFWQNGKVLDI